MVSMPNPAAYSEEIAGGPSLQDDFLRDFMSAGVYDFASDIGIIQDGQIPSVKSLEQNIPNAQWSTDRSGVPHAIPPGRTGAYYGNSQVLAQGGSRHPDGSPLPQFIEGTVLRSSQQNTPTSQRPTGNVMPTGAAVQAGTHAPKAGAGARASVGAGSHAAAAAGVSAGEVALPEDKGEPFQLKKKKKSGKGSVSDKGGKGLRHFSMKVCTKVESKGRTTYNEVADELVAELSGMEHGGTPDVAYDEKNIRRRVYDALNVLMAMDIISKEKKEITWRGLPTTKESNVDLLREEQKRVRAQIESKQVYLKELVDQKKALEGLIDRNKQAKPRGEGNSPDSAQYNIQLPFLVVQTRTGANVDVQLSEDRQLYSLDFTYNPFEIHDENYVLQNMVQAGKIKVKQDENSVS